MYNVGTEEGASENQKVFVGASQVLVLQLFLVLRKVFSFQDLECRKKRYFRESSKKCTISGTEEGASENQTVFCWCSASVDTSAFFLGYFTKFFVPRVKGGGRKGTSERTT